MPRTSELAVVTMIQNPLRWRSRYENYKVFARGIKAAGAKLYTAEIAFGDRPFRVAKWWHPFKHLRLRTTQELWLKENALNLLIGRLPKRIKYVAWIDADIIFTRPDWAQETVQQLQHHNVVQLFTHSLDLDAENRPMSEVAHSFAYSYVSQFPRVASPGPLPASYAEAKSRGVYWHPGFAWAARRDVLDKMGGLIDIGILGAGDWYMANAFIGEVEKSIPPIHHENYKRTIREWASGADTHVGRDIGYVDGLITHLYHGRKQDRQYQKRTPVLGADIFDPARDLARDKQGLWVLRPGNVELRDKIRAINRARREDG